jgi:glycerophosphoryl diester phosphodiesterase
MVEVDVQLTKDGRAVVFHDDVLADGTCINTLTLRELRTAGSERIPKLKKFLKRACLFTFRQDGPLGIIDIEIKVSLPNCDPDNVFDSMLVDAVVFNVRQADMIDQALIESFSPPVVALIAETAPEIARGLSVLSVVQFLTSKQIEDATGLEAILIDKIAGFGLQWAEISGLFCLPGYDSMEQFT